MTAKWLAFPAIIGTVLIVAAALWALPDCKAPITDTRPKQALGLITSLPIYWNESADIDGMLARDGPVHWVRQQLEQDYDLVPLDTLAAKDVVEPGRKLKKIKLLLLAQPAALPPADFVALDSWVRSGGRLLLFADPMLTEHSGFGLGDKRRPQDIAMLSPILARWGLEQVYEEGQGSAARSVSIDETAIPIRQAGRFEQRDSRFAECSLMSDDVVASCTVGSGYALIVSDAALLERDGGSNDARKALRKLLNHAFESPQS